MMRAGILAAALALSAGMAHGQTAIAPVAPTPVDTTQIEVVDAAGTSHDLSGILPDAPAILHFWATWCGPCREELPELAAYHNHLAESGLGNRLIVVALERSPRPRIDAFLDELGVALDTWQDRAGSSSSAFALFGMPSTILIDAEGRVVGRHSGPLAWKEPETRAGLKAHLDGE